MGLRLDRCDFSSIMTCLKNHISESNQMNQPEFLYEVFEDFMDSPESKDFSFDNGLVCRWMTGQAKISPKICTYYARPSKQEKLAETLQHNLIPLMTDCNKALQDVYLLFMQKQLARSERFNIISVPLLIGTDIHPVENHFTVFYFSVAFLDADLALTNRLNLRAGQYNACLICFLYKIIVVCLFIVGYQLAFFFSHYI